MQIRLKTMKLKSATVIETIIALLILMISFSAGMVIYNRVVSSGVSNEKLRMENEVLFLMDSLEAAGVSDPLKIVKSSGVFEVSYTADERFPGMLLMEMTFAGKGAAFSKRQKWIKRDEQN